MSTSEDEKGIIAVLMERFESQRLPRALALKEKLDRGELIDEFDLEFLKEVLTDSTKAMPLLERHPEFQPLASRITSLYSEITEKALANEKAASQ